MGIIKLETHIKAPVEICFDLARSVEVHLQSTAHTQERAVAGRISGLCELGDTITWRAKHFGLFQHMKVAITKMEPFSYFQDRMIEGAFKSFTHDHYFEQKGGVTVMRDCFAFRAPLGILGKLSELLFLDRYMLDLLKRRNQVIKELAESGWKHAS